MKREKRGDGGRGEKRVIFFRLFMIYYCGVHVDRPSWPHPGRKIFKLYRRPHPYAWVLPHTSTDPFSAEYCYFV